MSSMDAMVYNAYDEDEEVSSVYKGIDMDAVWKTLPYDLVKKITQYAGLNYNCTQYIRFTPNRLTEVPYINFPVFNLMSRFVGDRRIVIVSNKKIFSMSVFDNTHNRFQGPDRISLYNYESGETEYTHMAHDSFLDQWVAVQLISY